MKIDLGEYDLLDRKTGMYASSRLYQGIDEDNIRSFEQDWKPLLAAGAAADFTRDERMMRNAEDSHWNWRKNVELASNPLIYEKFCVECDGKTQGLMIVRKTSQSRDPEDPYGLVVYVELLATAPWNRPRFTREPIYKGVGTLLFGAAVSVSLDEGLLGRVGLHSLAGAEDFYRESLRMKDCGPDALHHDLHYFELSSAEADALAKEGG